MSDRILRLIPTDPNRVPDSGAQDQARQLLTSFLPQAAEISITAAEEVRFIDAGSNFKRVACCTSGTDLAIAWWQQAMDIAYQTRFEDLSAVVPCCRAVCSLNDLIYEWDQGFARLVLEARNPGTDLGDDEIRAIERALDCTLRTIWAHY
jgi:hypothetical protein